MNDPFMAFQTKSSIRKNEIGKKELQETSSRGVGFEYDPANPLSASKLFHSQRVLLQKQVQMSLHFSPAIIAIVPKKRGNFNARGTNSAERNSIRSKDILLFH
jgi:hypothetical protein